MSSPCELDNLKLRSELPASQHFMNEREFAEYSGLSQRTVQRLRWTNPSLTSTIGDPLEPGKHAASITNSDLPLQSTAGEEDVMP